MKRDALDFRWELRPNMAYCAKCGWEDGDARNLLGTLLWCPNDDRCGSERHHARIVSGNAGKQWLRNEWWLIRYALKWSPRRWRWWARTLHDRAGLYVFLQWLAVGAAILLVARGQSLGEWLGSRCLAPTATLLALGLAAYVVLDILLVNTAIAFAMRQPAQALRSAVFGLSSFALIAVAYSVPYRTLAPSLKNVDNWWDAVYFSFVTIATVGYGDAHPNFAAANPILRVTTQGVIIAEILTGLYFLAIILTTVVQWANSILPWHDNRKEVEH